MFVCLQVAELAAVRTSMAEEKAPLSLNPRCSAVHVAKHGCIPDTEISYDHDVQCTWQANATRHTFEEAEAKLKAALAASQEARNKREEFLREEEEARKA